MRKTRFNRDFVRLKIACRNVELVPRSAEGNLGLFIYDFVFEREVSQEDNLGNMRVAGEVDVPETQPSPKKQRTYQPNIGASGSKADIRQKPINESYNGKHQYRIGSVEEISVRLSGSAPSKSSFAKTKA
jgi:hypothetical protein